MKKNIGVAGRVIRGLIGLALLAFAWWQSSWLALALALFTFYEALASWCVFYQIIGKSTCPIDQRTQNQNRVKGEFIMLDSKRLGFSGGILWGLVMFVLTVVSIYTGYANQWLNLMANIYPGYSISWEGSIIGLIYGFIDGFIGLFILAWLYNKLDV